MAEADRQQMSGESSRNPEEQNMKVFEPGKKKPRGLTEKIAVLDEGDTNPTQRYEIRWQELYEFTAEIEAASYEEALKQANVLLSDSAMLTDLTEWRCGDGEDTAHSTVNGCELEASFDSQGIVECLPATDEDGDDAQDPKPGQPTAIFTF